MEGGAARSVFAGVAVLALATLEVRADDEGAGTWYMDGANAGRTSCVDVEPVRTAPAEAWRRKLDEGCIAEPVVWNGVVFVLSKARSGAQILSAVDVRTGALLGRVVRFKRVGADARLAVWNDVVLVVQREQTEAYAWKGTGLYPKWTQEGGATSPCVVAGVAFVGNLSFDVVGGRRLGLSDGLWTQRTDRAMSAAFRPGDSAVLFAMELGWSSDYPGRWVLGRSCGLTRISGGPSTMTVTAEHPKVPTAVVSDPLNGDLSAAIAVRIDPPDAASPGAWVIDAQRVLTTPSGKSGRFVVHVENGPNELPPVVLRPAVARGVAYSFGPGGELVAVRADGSYSTIAQSAELPAGRSRSRLSAARGVLCQADWAYDVGSRRVLWTRPSAASDVVIAPVIPAGDGVVIVRTEAGEIFCLTDPARPAASEAARAPAASKPADPPPLPVEGDGVVLRDGRQVLGDTTVDRVDGSVSVAGKDGPRRFAASEVLVGESGGKVLASAPEQEVYRVVWDALGAAVVPRLEEVVGIASQLGLRTQGAAWIETARRFGLSEARVAELKRKLPMSDAPPVEPKLRGLERRSAPLLDACAADIARAAKWCGVRGFAIAGGVLASASANVDREQDGVDAATTFVPRSFRTCLEHSVAGSAWIEWARALFAAEASVVEPDDPAWKRCSPDWWAPPKALAFRTRNLLLFTRAVDPAVVVPCLTRGEAAVRGLHWLLGVEDPVKPAGDDERLRVLLHRSQGDYLGEAGAAAAGSAGYFSPAENVSRFFVPKATLAGGSREVGRRLFEVLAHELTHHYIEARWAPSLGPPDAVDRRRQPGFWVVEGIAEFMGDQIVDSESQGLTFEDPSVKSVSLCASLDRSGWLLPFGSFVDMDQAGFATLGDAHDFTVHDRRTDLVHELSQKHIYYEQAAALVFYMRNGRSEGGRRALVDYLRRYYLGRQSRGSWKVLRFDSAWELQQGFLAWLRAL